MRRSIVLPAALVLLGVAVLGRVALDDTGDDVGTVTIGEAATPDASAPPASGNLPPTPDTDAAADTSSAPTIGTSSARIGDVDLSPPPAPTTLRIDSLGVDAVVTPVGIDPDGLMTVPEDVTTVGWYEFGSAPADGEGTIVLAGHVDDRVQGRGAFFDLRAAEVGAEVEVTDADGVTTTWRITGRTTYEKESLPVDSLYERAGQPRLVLVTCGGDFDRAARSYESNVVVEAELVA